MTDTPVQEEAPVKRRRRAKASPNAELAKRRKERQQRGATDHGFTKRLGLDESKLDAKNYRYRWVNDTPGNISSLEAREWERVDPEQVDGQLTVRVVGTKPDGSPLESVLMRKWSEWFDEDTAKRQEHHKKNIADMMRGKGEDQRSPESDGQEYAVKTNRVETVVTDRVSNPDFE